MIDKLRIYCKYLANRKLKFISNNDRGLDTEDFVNELLAKGVTAAEKYDTQNALHTLNIAKKAAHNHAMRLIEWHTAQKRRRVVSDSDGYHATTQSLEAMEEAGLEPLRPTTDVPLGVAKYLDNLPEPVRTIFIMSVWEHKEPHFETWLADNGKAHLEGHELVKAACEFYEIPLESLQKIINLEKGLL